MINKYYFGSITIDNKIYNHDVEVRWNGEVLKWQRQEGHIVDIDDIKRAIEQNPEVIIIGTGYSGIARVTEKVQDSLKEKSIELIIDLTEEATRTFNAISEKSEEERKQKRAIGLFHLTC